jgi:hypothetical protein
MFTSLLRRNVQLSSKVVFIVLLLPLTALADTFTIQNGTVFNILGTLGFNVSGTNFSANGGDTPTPFFGNPAVGGQPFTSTSRLFLSGGNYTFNGVTYNPLESGSTWTLTTSALIPQGFTGGTLTGTANVRGDVSLENQLAPRHTILGSSSAVLQFLNVGNTTELRRVDVSFSNTINGNGAVPTVPEPGTWLLLASGLIGVGLYRGQYGIRK